MKKTKSMYKSGMHVLVSVPGNPDLQRIAGTLRKASKSHDEPGNWVLTCDDPDDALGCEELWVEDDKWIVDVIDE